MCLSSPPVLSQNTIFAHVTTVKYHEAGHHPQGYTAVFLPSPQPLRPGCRAALRVALRVALRAVPEAAQLEPRLRLWWRPGPGSARV